MALPTDFTPESRVGKLWQKMIEYSEANGESRNSLENKVNRGYLTGYYPDKPHRVNDLTRIESAEVLEFAYSDTNFYQLLVKHGFPVPFAMDDFDDKTTIDKKWHDTITKAVDEIGAKLRGEAGMREGTDKFKRELAKRIYEYILSFHPREIEDCKPERVDWDSLENTCGYCSEVSSVLYFAYRHAGLNPVFLESLESEPTCANYFRLEGLPRNGGGHVFVGVPLGGKNMLEADVALRRFGEHDPFMRLQSERYFAGGHLMNLSLDLKKGQVGELTSQILEILPDSTLSALSVLMAEMNTMDPLKMASSLSWFMGRFPDSPRRQFHIAELHYLHASAQHLKFAPDIFSALKEFIKADPKGNSLDVMMLGNGTIDSLETAKASAKTDEERRAIDSQLTKAKLMFADAVEDSVRGNSRYLPVIKLLEEVEAVKRSLKDRVVFYRDLVKADPTNNIFRYLHADACLRLLLEYNNTGQIDDIQAIRSEGMQEAKKLVELEPNLPKLHYLLSVMAYLVHDDALALSAGKRSLDLCTDGFIADNTFLKHLIRVGIRNADNDLVNAAKERLHRDYHDKFAPHLHELLEQSENLLYAGPDGRPYAGEDLDRRANIVQGLIQTLAEKGDEKSSLDSARFKQGALLSMSLGAPVDIGKPFFDGIADHTSDAIQKQFEDLLSLTQKNVETPLFASNSPNMGLDRLRLIERYLVPGRKAQVIPSYLKFAAWAFDCDRPEVGSEAVAAAIEVDPEKAVETFLKETFEPRFNSIDPGRVARDDVEKRLLVRLIPPLDSIWDNSGILPDESIHKLEDAYDRLTKKLEAAGDKVWAGFARERSVHLRDICPR